MAEYDWDPIEELRRIERRIGEMISGRPEHVEVTRPESQQVPRVDVEERGNNVIVTADMPGMDKGDIRINVTDDGVLEISGERGTEAKKEKEGYIRHERGYARYYRSIRLPAPVDKAAAKATYKDGVLTVTLPMAAKARPSDIPIS